jgi:VanZ family protein
MAVAGFVASVTVGALDEWHQTFLPGRHGQFSDVGFDAVGAAIGGALLVWIRARLNQRLRSD